MWSNHIKSARTPTRNTQREKEWKRVIEMYHFLLDTTMFNWHSIRSHTHIYGGRFAFHSHLPHCVVSGFKLLLSPLTPYRCDKVIIMVHRILSVALFFHFILSCVCRDFVCHSHNFIFALDWVLWLRAMASDKEGPVVLALFIPSIKHLLFNLSARRFVRLDFTAASLVPPPPISHHTAAWTHTAEWVNVGQWSKRFVLHGNQIKMPLFIYWVKQNNHLQFRCWWSGNLWNGKCVTLLNCDRWNVFFSRSLLLYLPLRKLTSILNQPFVCVSFWFAVTIENEVEIFTINKF